MSKTIDYKVKILVDGKEQLVTITADAKTLQKSLQQTQTTATRVNKALIGFNQSVMAVSTLRDSIQSLTAESNAYSSAMAKANTMAGKQGQDFQQMKDSVSDLAKEVPMARDALADGLYQVISNGVPENNWIDYLRASARASVGGIADLGETVKVTSTIIKNYGLEWNDATAVQDKIQLTAKNGVTSFEQLAAALPRVTGNAATLGVSIDDLMATFATLTGVSGNTAEVSTQLAAIFTALIKPSSEATKMAQKMGIEFDAAAIKSAGGFRQFLTQLDTSVQDYAQRTGTLSQEIYGKLFGSAESLRAIGPLTGQLSEKFQQNADAMKNSTGTINEAFTTMASTGTSAMQMLKNQFAGITDAAASVAKNISPYLNFAATLGLSLSGLVNIKNAFIGVASSVGLTTARINILRTAIISAQGGIIGLVAALGTAAFITWSEQMKKNSESARRLREESERLKAIEKGRTDGQKEATAITTQATSAADRQAQKIAALRTIIKDSNASMKDRLQAIRDLRDLVPDYTAKINDQGRAFESNTDKVDDYIKKLKELYIVEAMEKKLKELYRKEIEQTGQVNTARREFESADAAYRTERQEQAQGSGIGYWTSFVQKLALSTAGGRGGRSGVAISESSNPTKSVKSDRRDNALQKLNNATNALRKTQTEQATLRTAIKTAIEAARSDSGGGNGGGGNGGGNKGGGDSTTPPPAEGSLDWYDQAISACEKFIKSTGDATAAEDMMKKKLALEADRKALAIKIGIEAPEKEETRNYLEQLQDQLRAAQSEFDAATTIEARVKASTRIAEIQTQINEATQGQLTITAPVEPTYIQKGSIEDRRRSYQNAQSRAAIVRSDYETHLIDRKQAQAQIDEINAMLADIGSDLKPIKLEVKADTRKAESGIDEYMQRATDSVAQFGSSLGQLGSAIKMPELNIAGTLAQAIATMTAGYATATAQAASMGPFAWIAFAATGLAELAAVITSVKSLNSGSYATGGIIPGTSYSGDRLIAHVNSGEMILNARQQQNLWRMANTPIAAPTLTTYQPPTISPTAISPTALEPRQLNLNLTSRITGRDLQLVLDKRQQLTSRT